MFERFTSDARQAVTGAQQEARRLHHAYIGTEHLLLSLLDRPETLAGRALAEAGLTRQQAVEAIVGHVGPGGLDGEALGALGIDLEAVRGNVEATFGAGALDEPAPGRWGRRRGLGRHLPFTSRAKKTLELSLREAVHLEHNHIGDGHVLLGLLREEHGRAAAVITERGIDVGALRRAVTTALAA